MDRHVLGVILCFTFLGGCNVSINGVNLTGVSGSGTLVTESHALPEFNQIRYGGSGTVRVTQGDTSEISITCDDNLMQYISTEVDGETLRIKTTRSINATEQTFDIVCPALRSLHISGSGSASLEGYEGTDLEVRLTGSGSADLGYVQAQSLAIAVTGSGSLRGSGQVESLHAKVTGSGGVALQELSARSVQASATGSGSLKLFATESFQGSTTGSGSIQCYGNPANTEHHSTGSGSIRFND